MKQSTVDRITEALIVLCVAAALAVSIGKGHVPGKNGSLAGLNVQVVEGRELEEFHVLVSEVRRKVDSNTDPGPSLVRLQEEFTGRHEVWAISARYEESSGLDGPAVVSYARAVRLEPDYIDENSGLFLGGRIEKAVDRLMGDLLENRDSGLDGQGKAQLEAAYFLKRRLAGGCE